MSGAVKLQCYSHAGRPARGGDHRHCGLTGNKRKPEEQNEEHRKTRRQETRRWLREFKGGCREAREKPTTLQGKADAEDESGQFAKMMESQTTPQAGPINYGLKRHFLP